MNTKIIPGELGRCAFAYGTGAIGYSLMEIAFRGFTHWTMTLTGGTCMTLFYLTEKKMHMQKLWKRCLAGAAIVTSLEFTVGCIVNKRLGWGVWDYSDQRFNLMGQICPQFCAVWFALCIPATIICKLIRSVGASALINASPNN